MPEKIVIVGGGFAGTSAARRLSHRLGDRAEITLLSEQNYAAFNPMLPEVVSSAVLPGQVIAPLRLVLRGGPRFVLGKATGLDLDARRVRYRIGREERSLDYDRLVLAVGGRAKLGMIPGMAEHGVALKLVGDALKLRNDMIDRLEQADHEPDPAARRRLLGFVIVGGGFSGVEVAGEIHDFVKVALPHYPNLSFDEVGVALVHSGERLLPELSASLGERARRSFERRGVKVRLNARAREADAEGLTVDTGDGGTDRYEAATIVCTIGTRPSAFIAKADLPKTKGRVDVQPDLSVAGRPELWAIGDCAGVPNAKTGERSPPTAQFAVRQGWRAADNIAAALDGRETTAFGHASLGMLATIGSKRGLANVCGVPLAGFPAWLLWRAFYLVQMPTFSRKVRLWVAWTWDMLFPGDIAQLRFTASEEADGGRDAPG